MQASQRCLRSEMRTHRFISTSTRAALLSSSPVCLVGKKATPVRQVLSQMLNSASYPTSCLSFLARHQNKAGPARTNRNQLRPVLLAQSLNGNNPCLQHRYRSWHCRSRWAGALCNPIIAARLFSPNNRHLVVAGRCGATDTSLRCPKSSALRVHRNRIGA